MQKMINKAKLKQLSLKKSINISQKFELTEHQKERIVFLVMGLFVGEVICQNGKRTKLKRLSKERDQ